MQWVGHLPRFATKSHGYCLYIRHSIQPHQGQRQRQQRQRRSSTRAFVVEGVTKEEIYRAAVTDHGRLPPPACLLVAFNCPRPIPSPAASQPASLRISTEAARHRLALAHHVSFRQKNAPMPCVQTPAASWQEVDGFERGGPLLSHPVQSHDCKHW